MESTNTSIIGEHRHRVLGILARIYSSVSNESDAVEKLYLHTCINWYLIAMGGYRDLL